MANLAGKTVFISGGSRGIGFTVALKAARDGANIAILAKTVDPHPTLPGTLHTAAQAIKKAGGNVLPIQCDIRNEDQVAQAVAKTVETFGGIDICFNNASAISITSVADTTMKRYDLMHQVNARGTFLVSKMCLPHLLKSENPHILNNCPPIDLTPSVWGGRLAYWMAKMGMSFCVLGMSSEFKSDGIAVNALWPAGMVATAAIRNLGGIDMIKAAMKPEMYADAAYRIFKNPARDFTGNFLIVEEYLRDCGMTDFDQYKIDPDKDLDEQGHYTSPI